MDDNLFIVGNGEILNVFSSFVIISFGLYGLYNVCYRLVREDYLLSETIKSRSKILYTLLTFVGFSSLFFHSRQIQQIQQIEQIEQIEQSLFANWIDIIFISIILVYLQFILSNKKKNQNSFSNKLKYIFLMFVHFISSVYIPQIHLILLFGSGFVVYKLIKYKIDVETNFIQSSNSNHLINTFWWVKKYFVATLIFWIIDYFWWVFANPYNIHWILHILKGLVLYKIIDVVRYIDNQLPI